jgi:hypothetical protein
MFLSVIVLLRILKRRFILPIIKQKGSKMYSIIPTVKFLNEKLV